MGVLVLATQIPGQRQIAMDSAKAASSTLQDRSGVQLVVAVFTFRTKEHPIELTDQEDWFQTL